MSESLPILTLLILVPVLGAAVVACLPKGNEGLLKMVGVTFAGILKSPLEHWLESVLAHPHHFASSSSTKLGLILVTTVAALAGVGIAYLIWMRRRVKESAVEPEVLRRAWYVDELYQRVVEAPARAFGNFSAFVVDAKVIDGTVNGVGALVRAGGSRLRTVQSGFVRNYALAVAVGAVAILAYAVARSA